MSRKNPNPPAPKRGADSFVYASVSEMASAFEAWENGLRGNPSAYMTPDECAAASVSQLSADRAAHFCALLDAQQKGRE